MTTGETSTALVAAPVDKTVAKYDEAMVKQKVKEIMAGAQADRAILKKQAPVRKGDGVSIPGIINRIAKNAIIGDGLPSYNVTFTIRSLKNISGQNIGSDASGRFLIMPLHLAELRKLKKTHDVSIGYPISRVDGSVIKHVAIVEYGNIRIFANSAPDDTYRAGAFATGLQIRLSAMETRKPKKVTAASQEEEIVRSLIRGADAAPVRQVALVVGGAPVAGKAAFVAPPSPKGGDQADPAEDTAPRWYVPTGYGGRWYPPVEIVKAYLDPALKVPSGDGTSRALTDVQRKSLELEYPDIAKNPGHVPAALKLCINYECGAFVPTSVEDYVGQSREDFMELVMKGQVAQSHWPFVSARLAAKRTGVAQDDDETLVLTSGSPADTEAMLGMRLIDPVGKVSSTVYVKYGFDDAEAFVKFVKDKDCNRMCIAFDASGEVWRPGCNYFDETSAGRTNKLMARGCVWEDAISAATGITELSLIKGDPDGVKKKHADWKVLAKKILANATVVFVCRVDEKNSGVMPANLRGTCGAGNAVFVSLSADNMMIDMVTLLRKHGIPITAQKAAELMSHSSGKQIQVPSPAIVKSADARSIGSTVCLTEPNNEDRLAAAIKAGCGFYVLCEKDITAASISRMNPAIGDAILDETWASSDDIILQSGTKIDAQDPLRQATAFVHGATTKYVWAVRQDVVASVRRAANNMDILANGGKYNADGYPIVESDKRAAAGQVLAIQDAAAASSTAPALDGKLQGDEGARKEQELSAAAPPTGPCDDSAEFDRIMRKEQELAAAHPHVDDDEDFAAMTSTSAATTKRREKSDHEGSKRDKKKQKMAATTS